MGERMALSVVMIVIGLILYRGHKWWLLHRAQHQNLQDPLLIAFRAGQPGILYFTADHCGACRFQQQPILATLQREGVQVIQIDADQRQADADRWGVMSLPTTFILDAGGKPQSVNYGVASAQKLRKQLESVS